MKTLIRFFSSVKLAIVLLIILAAASILGTLIPQGRSAEEYAARYGQMSGLLIKLQLTGLYHSIWYLAILGLFALNILVCTLTRLGPKWRRGMHPSLGFDAKSVGAMKVKDRIKRNAAPADTLGEIKSAFGRAGYKVRTETKDGRTNVLARKKIWGIFGSDIVHLGLLVIIAGGILSGLTSVRMDLKMKEGEIQTIPGTDFALRLEKFTTLYYDDARIRDPEQRQVKSWISLVSVLEGGREVLSRPIEVNHPLHYKGFNFYQSSYGYDQEVSSPPADLSFELKNFEAGRVEIWAKKKSNPSFLKKINLKIGERTVLDEPEGTSIAVRQYLPDFVLGEGNRPETRSPDPNNPAALIEAYKGEEMVMSGWVFEKYPDFTQMHASRGGGKSTPYSVLEAAKDRAVPLIWLGCVLVTAGLGLAFYWPTWEVRAVVENVQNRTDVTLGGLASKSREAFQAQFESIAASLRRSK